MKQPIRPVRPDIDPVLFVSVERQDPSEAGGALLAVGASLVALALLVFGWSLG